MSNELWDRNDLQFPRLPSELVAADVGHAAWAEVCDSMDIDFKNLNELLERAQKEWELIKAYHTPVDPSKPGKPPLVDAMIKALRDVHACFRGHRDQCDHWCNTDDEALDQVADVLMEAELQEICALLLSFEEDS